MRSKQSRSGDAQFWAMADYFRHLGRVWGPRDAGYELVRYAEGDGKEWVVRLKFHIAPATLEDDGKRSFRATVTWWPAQRREQTDTAHVKKRGGWYAKTKKFLRDIGYDGDWELSPYGTYGNFCKVLRNVADVRREAKRLESLLLDLLSEAK